MASLIWVFAFVVAMALIMIGVLMAVRPGPRSSFQIGNGSRASVPVSTHIQSKSRLLQSRSNGTATFFWPFTMAEGIPFVRVRLESQPDVPLSCVLDSGSGHLNIASQECDACNAKHGVYVSSVRNSARHTVEYGTQEDTVTLRRDRLLVQDTNSSTSVAAEDVTAVDVEVNVTVARTKDSSNFNVLGISNSGFLAALLGPDRALLICFKPGNRRGFVTNIRHTDAVEYRECAAARAPLYRNWTLPFYMVRLRAVRIGKVKVPTPMYCILDTGSNVISFPPQTFAALGDNVKMHKPPLHIEFGEPGPAFAGPKEDGGRITVPASNYMNGFQMMMDDDVPDFSVGSVMVLGCNGMLGYSFVFERGFVSVVQSNRNVCNGVHTV